MPRTKTISPRVSREKGQRSIDLPEMLYRILPPWSNPTKFLEANTWRAIVASQPIAVACREALISSYLSLDWKIEPKDSELRDELKSDIDYYTDFFSDTGKYYYDEIIEWIGRDMLDIPFGAAAEVGRQGDSPEGKVLWLELLDGGTLFPYPNDQWPVGQYVREAMMTSPIYFPYYAINRVYYSPRTEIKLEGWGMPPPEKIYLALELLNRGDRYYANLLLDTPEAGILDLGDMSKTSAEQWVKAYRDMLGGVDPMKVPVLYEHNNEVKFIPFGRPPTDLMFDRVTAKYASMVTSGYGLTLSDIGIQTTTSGGDTLAGSIRDERKTRRTGFARFKRKMVSFFNFMLPDTLYYKIIDQDDELSVAMSRARLANSTAAAEYINNRIFTPNEMRRQAISDGLITISIPEDVPEDDFPELPEENPNERTNLLGKPIAPSQGGHGEVLPRGDVFSDEINKMMDVGDTYLKKMVRSVISPLREQTTDALTSFSEGELDAWNDWYDEALWGNAEDEFPELTFSTLSLARSNLNSLMKNFESWWTIDVSPRAIYNDWEELFHRALLKEYRGSNIQFDRYGEQLRGKIADILSKINRDMPRGVQNCIISGAKKALLDKEFLARSLDDDGIIGDNKTVEYVRQELLQFGGKIIDKFAVQLSDSINEILGDIENEVTESE